MGEKQEQEKAESTVRKHLEENRMKDALDIFNRQVCGKKVDKSLDVGQRLLVLVVVIDRKTGRVVSLREHHSKTR